MPVCIQATWDDVPHLTKEQKDDLWATLPPHERAARSKGIPALGSGAIYPVPEEVWLVDDFRLPDYWPRAYGMDVGWNRTAVVWLAWDRDSDTVYEYSEHYLGEELPSTHAAAINARGSWIPGAIDPAARGRSQKDGERLVADYQALGLDLHLADNAVEAGIYKVHQRLATGRLKTFRYACPNVARERRTYHRDEKGKVVKQNDHAMDAERYGIMTGLVLGRVKPAVERRAWGDVDDRPVNVITGY